MVQRLTAATMLATTMRVARPVTRPKVKARCVAPTGAWDGRGRMTSYFSGILKPAVKMPAMNPLSVR